MASFDRDVSFALAAWWRVGALFTLMACAWSWLIWFASMGASGAISDNAIILGTFGPSIAGVFLLYLQSGRGTASWRGALPAFLAGFALAGIALAVRHYAALADNWGLYPAGLGGYRLDLSAETIAWFVAICVTSGLVFGAARSDRRLTRAHLASLVPDRRALIWAIPLLAFFPLLFIMANEIARLLGVPVIHQRYLLLPAIAVAAIMLLQIFKVAMLTGGNEEAGWRGVLLPALQRSMNPLLAALLIGLVWELWHLPLVIGGVYGDQGVAATVLLRLRSTVLFSILLAALYNRTRGNVALCVLLHAAFNVQQAMFAASQVAFLVALVVIAAIVWHERMWRRDSGFDPLAPQRG